jgi:molecular chaperone GrpE
MENYENQEQEMPEMTNGEVNEEQIVPEKEVESAQGTDWESRYHETYDQFVRLFAEFDNYKRRTLKEKIEMSKSAGFEVMQAVLPVLDDFSRAMSSFEKTTDLEALRVGVELIHKKLIHVLTEKGLQEIRTIGEPFNSDLHEAVTQIPVPREDMKGKVIDEVEKGYEMNGRIIRHPKVVIGY